MQPTDPSQANPPSPYGQPPPPHPSAGYPQPQQGQPVPQQAPAAPHPSSAPPGPPPQQQQQYGQPMPQPSGAPFAKLPGPGWAPERRILIGDAMTAFGGLLVFVFSFAPFVGYSDSRFSNDLERHHLPTWFSAWATETFMAPLTWFVVLGGLVAISLAAARMAVPRDREVAGFRTGHLQIGVTIFLFLALFGYATSSKSAIFGHDFAVQFSSETDSAVEMSFSWGGYLMLFGALVAAVGAVLSHLEIGPTIYPQPPRPQAPMPPQGYPQAPQYQPEQAMYQQPPEAAYPQAGDSPTAPYPVVNQPVQQAPQGQPAPQPPMPPQGQQWPNPQ
ncbi:hypothetical protein Aru02nite_45530 [Actinocatenispora rupis]|uniref:Uncharacterized protein n=1 Tax=Actinocatenispora rupis TaxID=519421 RepID=A0A8J3NFD7_9ACTN|nr:hypothetical protein Aru02nite_45530 [Actinocatenispora rupis]